MATVTIAVEGPTDTPVVRRILALAGHDLAFSYGGHGKHEVDRSLPGYNNAARLAAWLVLRDLDHDADCPADLVQALLPRPAPHMRLRIAVRETEAWLLADRDALADFLSIPPPRIPDRPDTLDDPKQTLVNLARRSRRRDIREDMVPRQGTSAVVGPAYTSRIEEFARNHWRPEVAAANSVSLQRTVARLALSWEGLP